MLKFLIRRLVQAAATVLCVLTIAFFLGRASGKPGALLLTDGATAEQIDQLNETLGFNRPLLAQYVDFALGVFRGDFGSSYRNPSIPAIELVAERLPATVSLALTSFVIGVVLALAAALSIHVFRSRKLRALFIWGGSLRQSVPDFFFGVLAVLVFSVVLGALPSLGFTGPASYVLPVMTIATGQFVLYVRLLDSALTEQSSQDYVRTAYARGKSHGAVVATEMLPNALLPVMTMAGLNLAGLLGGAVIVEQVFAWPGVGEVLINAVSQRDFAIVQAGLLVVALMFVVVNIVVDVLYSVLDPRVRLS
ncbi:ABC transporter permease [Arthrobacter sp. 35W]|uniref:ABC transporter permease n=1 Tax=Arthrobacter sp. 35W TaxID=1132441 RepID=UPI000405CB1B|nr:ABC transporter permease [Arthrobacter sp. 35W]